MKSPFYQIKKEILETDFSLLLADSATHSSQQFVQSIAASPSCCLPKVWDHALERACAFGTSSSQALLRLLSFHVLPDNQCPIKSCPLPVTKDTVCSRFLLENTTLDISIEQCMDTLNNCSEIYDYGESLNQTFRIHH